MGKQCLTCLQLVSDENCGCSATECECSNPKLKGMPACQRCMDLDGMRVTKDSKGRRLMNRLARDQDVISALRALGRCNRSELFNELSHLSTRTIERSVANLVSFGRIRQYTVDLECPDSLARPCVELVLIA